MANDIVRVEGAVQHYAWGVKGSASLVAQIHKRQSPNDTQIDEEVAYAELWLGAHPSCPSRIVQVPLPEIPGTSKAELPSSPRDQTVAKNLDACVSEPVTAAQTADTTAECRVAGHAVAEPLVSASSATPREAEAGPADACSPEAMPPEPASMPVASGEAMVSQEPSTEQRSATDPHSPRLPADNARPDTSEPAAAEDDDGEEKFEDLMVGGIDDAVAEAPLEQRTPTADAFLASSADHAKLSVEQEFEGVQIKDVGREFLSSEPPAENLVQDDPDRGDEVTPEGLDVKHVLGDRKRFADATNALEWLAMHGCAMPYLFKVLSVGTPLSLQLHPDLDTAKILHAEDPTNYKDPYDKPEMAFALSETFEAFCGFRRMKDILAISHVIPPLAKLLKAHAERTVNADDESQQLKNLMRNLFATSQAEIEAMIQEVMELDFGQISSTKAETDRTEKTLIATMVKSVRHMVGKGDTGSDNEETARTTLRLFKRLHQYYPSDRGLFACFFLNYCQLKAGECLAISPRTIHAYIKGDCLEVMKASDNVIRAGLTPKFQDVEKLLALVHYKALNVANAMIKGVDVNCKLEPLTTKSSLKVFIPSITDSFRIYLLRLTPGCKAVNIPIPRWHPLIIFVLRGSGELDFESADAKSNPLTLGPATTFLLTHWESLGVRNQAEGDKNMKLGSTHLGAEELADDSAAVGELCVVFIVPNVDSHRLKRSAKDIKKSKSQRSSPSPRSHPGRG